jgi:hypothetical protein
MRPRNVISYKDGVPRKYTPSGLVKTDRRFRGVYCLHDQGDKSSLMTLSITRTSPEDTRFETDRSNNDYSPLQVHSLPLVNSS